MDTVENKRRNWSSASQSTWWCECERVYMTSHLPHCRFQTARGIAIPIPRLRGEGSSRCLKPRPRAPPGTLNHVVQGFRPPGLALHGYRRLHLGERAAPSSTGYTGDRDDPAATTRICREMQENF